MIRAGGSGFNAKISASLDMRELSEIASMEVNEILFQKSAKSLGEQIKNFFSSVIERLLAVIILIFASPLFIVIPVLIKMQDGGKVFYVSRRLGQYRRPYNMYKFRSLSQDAEEKIGGQFLNHKHDVETHIGGFLRETRLDEVPQLINVVLGNMQLVGPRPERPSLYLEQCAHIPGYEKRFKAKPGLFGYSQLFTPHSTPKRIRTFIDNRYIDNNENTGFVVLWTFWALFYLAQRLFRKFIILIRKKLLLRWKVSESIDRRKLKRTWPRTVCVAVKGYEGNHNGGDFRIGDINQETLLLFSPGSLSEKTPIEIQFKVQVPAKTAQRTKTKSAKIEARIRHLKEIKENPVTYVYLMDYTAVTPLNRYKVDKYLLKDSIL